MLKVPILVLLAAVYGEAVTLQQLSLDEMTRQSTAVVRARIVSSKASFTGNTIYTHYKLQITETLKGSSSGEVMIPGGVAGRYSQTFPGVPQLQTGKEYLLFLWASSSGITHLTGLSQGVFDLSTANDGTVVAARGSIGELMLDKTGRPVRDQAIQLRLSAIRGRLTPPRAGGAVR